METTAGICPITGEPLPVSDPGRIVSRTACRKLKVACSNLTDLMSVVDQLVAGEGRAHENVGGGHVGGPRAPLNLTILDAASDWRDTIDLWATELLRYVHPGMRRLPGDWRSAQQILTRYAERCAYWTETWGEQIQPTGAMCIDEVMEAVKRLEWIVNPREAEVVEVTTDEAVERLSAEAMTIRAACEVVRLMTGKVLPSSTVRSWERRGKIAAVGDPKRYPVMELVRLAGQPT